MATATVGVNSYVDVAEATEYYDGRFGYDLWAGLNVDQQNQALISAYSELEYMCQWYGSKTDNDQAQEFPRDGSDEVPDEIKAAQCEIAYSMVSAGSTSVENSDVLTKLKAGDVELEFKGAISATGGYTDHLKALLRTFGNCAYGGGTSIIDVGRA